MRKTKTADDGMRRRTDAPSATSTVDKTSRRRDRIEICIPRSVHHDQDSLSPSSSQAGEKLSGSHRRAKFCETLGTPSFPNPSITPVCALPARALYTDRSQRPSKTRSPAGCGGRGDNNLRRPLTLRPAGPRRGAARPFTTSWPPCRRPRPAAARRRAAASRRRSCAACQSGRGRRPSRRTRGSGRPCRRPR